MSRKKKRTAPGTTSPQAQAAALEKFRPLLDESAYAALLAELERPLYPAFRLNPLKAKPGSERFWAQRYGWQLRPVPFCPTGWWVTDSRQPISQTLEHRMGHYYIQEAASMLPVELFDLDPLERPLILDMAASPGGKTTHLVSRTQDRGLVIANDSGQERLTALRLILQTWGAVNVAATRFPAEKFGRWYPGVFDRILLDAPCSMQSLRPTESHPMRPITAREQSALARRQTAMLASALAALKPGGQIVYATCTLAPQEDEAVLDALLSAYPQAVRIGPLADRLPQPAPALIEAFGQVFHPQVENAARLWPQRFGTAGFFAALLTKERDIDFPHEDPPARPLTQIGQQPLSPAECLELENFFSSVYAHDLASILEDQQLTLWRSRSAVYALPLAFLRSFADLPCHLLGLKLAEAGPDGWQPAHEWVSRFTPDFHSGVLTISPEHLEAWLSGQDVPLDADIPHTPGGIVILKDADQRFLGRAKLTTGRLKNLLPRRIL